MIKSTTNKLVPILVGVVAIVGIAVFFMSSGDKEERFSLSRWKAERGEIGPGDTDTPEQTIKTLRAQVEELKRSTAEVVENNAILKRDREHLVTALEEQFNKKYNEEDGDRQKRLAKTETELRQTTSQLETLKRRLNNEFDKLRLSAEQRPQTNETSQEVVPLGSKGPIIVEPIGVKKNRPQARRRAAQQSPQGRHVPGVQRVASLLPQTVISNAAPPSASARQQRGNEKLEPIPRITIPKGTTLGASTTWTGIIGRVPKGNKVQNPYPWKAIVSADNMSANGFQIPDLKRAIVGGYAIGDPGISCVTARIDYMTFIFTDGTVYTTPEIDGSDLEQSMASSKSLGYAGNPCIMGKLISNATPYITNKILLGAFKTTGLALAQGETTSAVSPIGGTSITTRDGDLGPFVAGQALTGGVNEISEYQDERMGNIFDVVVVPPRTRIDINIERQIEIDYDPEGRKVVHQEDSLSQYGFMD